MPLAAHARLMADYNRWMNARLYDACRALPDEVRKRDVGAFFGSLHATLDHLLWADYRWLGRFDGRAYPGGPIGVPLFDDFAALSEARAAMDARLVEWAGELSDAWLAGTMAFESPLYRVRQVQPRWVYVTHLFNHQTHHRGQVTTLLSQLGVDIGPTDLPVSPALLAASERLA